MKYSLQAQWSLLVLIIILIVVPGCEATGNDKPTEAMVTRPSTWHVYSTEIPWSKKHVTKEPNTLYSINEAVQAANPGDKIVVHEGIYREKVIVNKNNITIINNDTDYVLISGAELVANWQDAAGLAKGIKVSDISGFSMETAFTQLFADGAYQEIARYPNKKITSMMQPLDADSGYAPISEIYKEAGANAKGYLTLDGEPVPNVDVSGGIVRALVGKNREYLIGNVTAASGNEFVFKGITTNWTKADAIAKSVHKLGWGFVMHKNLIDQPGEWFVESKKLYYMPAAGRNIQDMRVEMQVREKVLVLNGTSGVTLKGLNFVAGNVDMQNVSGALIENSSMRYLSPFFMPKGYGDGDSKKTGVYLNKSSNNVFKNTYIAHSWGNAIEIESGTNNSIQNCRVEDIGWLGIFTSAVYISGDRTTISNSTFGDTGRFHIRIRDDVRVDIMDSDFYGAMKMGEDAGSIEATSTGKIGPLDMKGSVIAYNKIHDIKGIPVSSSGYNKQYTLALYMEDTENYTAHHNLIYNIKADNYNGPVPIAKEGSFLYVGPRYNAMYKPINYYNNTAWNYDKAIGIWNIDINNREELGVSEDSGNMKDGHFINNIFMKSKFNYNYAKQNITNKGETISGVKVANAPVLTTDDFQAFIDHIKQHDYHFNPEHNYILEPSSESAYFADAANGNFRLKETSSAVGGGKAIPGITTSTSPDAGALEGSERVLHAGATLVKPVFREVVDSQH